MRYDVIIIGGGPAGLTAALYAKRANKTVLVIEKGCFGGQITERRHLLQFAVDTLVKAVCLVEIFFCCHHIIFHSSLLNGLASGRSRRSL